MTERPPTDADDDVVVPPDAPVGPVLAFENPQAGARGLLRSGLLVSAVVLLGNACNILFHVGTARLMGRDEYSLLTTMFAVFLVASVPLLAIQATVTREMTVLLEQGDEHGAGLVLRSTLRTVLRAGLITVAVAAVLFYPLMTVLNINRPLPILAVVVAFLVQIPSPIAGGALQASERFTTISWTQALQAVLKLGLGLGLAALGFGASAVTFGVAAAIVVSVALMFWVLRPILRQAKGHPLPARRIIGAYAVGAAAALGFNTILLNTDLVWARGALGAGQAGLYAAASVATSVLLLIPIGLNTVLFPRVARLGGEDGMRGHLWLAAGIVGLVAAPAVALLFLIPTQLLHIAFGTQYDAAAPWLGPLGIAMAMYAMTIVYLNHLLALGRSGVAWLMGAFALLQQTLFLLMHASGRDIVTVQIITAAVALIGCELYQRTGFTAAAR